MPAERTTMRQVREVLRLKFVGGVATREIARRIGVAASTVRATLKRFRAAGDLCSRAHNRRRGATCADAPVEPVSARAFAARADRLARAVSELTVLAVLRPRQQTPWCGPRGRIGGPAQCVARICPTP
jgi:transposase-like protein